MMNLSTPDANQNLQASPHASPTNARSDASRARSKADAQRLLHCMDNGFDSYENCLRPTQAPTFTLRTWAAARRLRQQREAEAQEVDVPEEEGNDPWAPPEVVDAQIDADGNSPVATAAAGKDQKRKTVVSTASLAAGGGLLAQFDDTVDPEEEVVSSYLRQESSAILASRRLPRMRRSRLDPVTVNPGRRKAPMGNATTSTTPGPSVATSVQSSAQVSGAAGNNGGSLLSALHLLGKSNGGGGGRDSLEVDWHRDKSLRNDSYIAKKPEKTLSWSAMEPSLPSRVMAQTPATAEPAATPATSPNRRVLPRSTFRTHDDPRTVITNRTGRLRGPMALIHPVRGVDRINYEELYRDQYTAAREMLDRDEAYMATMENLDFHMASVKFTFNKMLEGKFMHDEAAKKQELDQRQKVLTRDYRLASSTNNASINSGGGTEASAAEVKEESSRDMGASARPPSAGARDSANPLRRLAQSSPMLRQ